MLQERAPEPHLIPDVPWQAAEVSPLVQATQLVTSSLDLPTVLQRIVTPAGELLRLPHSALLLREGDELRFTATDGTLIDVDRRRPRG